ncbi:MAG TPA: methylated-DNA--[protein]-cysteine S-methyltransferase [Magnetospirillaceae bacterium]|nr:methylated-DNA--[protein]-cysteine S-methyltransferase [Magnetospirillaceae bacterium]
MTEFQQAVLDIVRIIPEGKVASYGQIAAYLGAPRAARQVGWAMRSIEGVPNFPWWRVLNNAGRISIKGNQYNSAQQQKELLEAEGVVVSQDFLLDIEAYRFKPKPSRLKNLSLDPEYIGTRLARFVGSD